MVDHADVALTVYQRVAREYRRVDLLPAERALLLRFRDEWSKVSMLDIGVGAGRTAYTFGAVAGRYLGIDYVPEMIDACRDMVGEDERTSFAVADARALRSLGRDFDVVLFSFNGIDTLDHVDRLAVLEGVRAVVADQGTFLFSTHSFTGLRSFLPVRDVPLSLSPRTAYHLVREGLRSARISREKRRLDWGRLDREGWVTAVDGTHGFDLEVYYVTPREQARQLLAAGFDIVEITDGAGSRIDLDYGGPSPWLNFLCRPRCDVDRIGAPPAGSTGLAV